MDKQTVNINRSYFYSLIVMKKKFKTVSCIENNFLVSYPKCFSADLSQSESLAQKDKKRNFSIRYFVPLRQSARLVLNPKRFN
jgi:hypothetical protein